MVTIANLNKLHGNNSKWKSGRPAAHVIHNKVSLEYLSNGVKKY